MDAHGPLSAGTALRRPAPKTPRPEPMIAESVAQVGALAVDLDLHVLPYAGTAVRVDSRKAVGLLPLRRLKALLKPNWSA